MSEYKTGDRILVEMSVEAAIRGGYRALPIDKKDPDRTEYMMPISESIIRGTALDYETLKENVEDMRWLAERMKSGCAKTQCVGCAIMKSTYRGNYCGLRDNDFKINLPFGWGLPDPYPEYKFGDYVKDNAGDVYRVCLVNDNGTIDLVRERHRYRLQIESVTETTDPEDIKQWEDAE